MPTDKVTLFGITIDVLHFDEAAKLVFDWSLSSRPARRFIATPNVNHVILFQKNERFCDAYDKASLVLADGRYVVHASKVLGKRLPECINGSDLVPAIFDLAESHGELKVFLLGALEGVADRAARKIREKWPNVTIVGTYSPKDGFENSSSENATMTRRINQAKPDLLIVGLSPPKQEIWIAEAIGDLDVNVAIGAGATIDFIAGAKPRAPRWMQASSLEWVHRIWVEPTRLGPRYFKDGLTFLYLFSKELLGNGRGASQERTQP